MLTIHAAPLVVPLGGREPLADGAVAVDGDRITAVGPFGEVAAKWPAARVRRWPGALTPGLVNRYGPELLEGAYHPDPREAGELGTEPLTGAAFAALDLTDARWGASARRGLQRMLRHGATAVAGPFARATVRLAVARSGLTVVARGEEPEGRPALDPLDPAALEQAAAGVLAPGARADLAAFAEVVPGACVATVLGGRLAFRRV